ncbi:MAG: hypothetical protein M3O31_18435, partial [Acidobacteriota bacterium]|nr:hypothetical protein [Acidobacteriota bacterium]
RTIATLGKTKGHVKDIQGMMRHEKASTTTDRYMQSLEHEVRTAINSIHDELAGNGSSGFKPGKRVVPRHKPAGSGKSAVAETVELLEADSALSQGDGINLSGLGVKWEPGSKAGASES